ncbi:hypothetical protein O9853_10605 [Vibrio lentus]|nr:hypothetical protein [Vibrio lentus]
MSDSEIKCAIKQYAEAYERLQVLQETEPSIPEGDQKLGASVSSIPIDICLVPFLTTN